MRVTKVLSPDQFRELIRDHALERPLKSSGIAFDDLYALYSDCHPAGFLQGETPAVNVRRYSRILRKALGAMQELFRTREEREDFDVICRRSGIAHDSEDLLKIMSALDEVASSLKGDPSKQNYAEFSKQLQPLLESVLGDVLRPPYERKRYGSRRRGLEAHFLCAWTDFIVERGFRPRSAHKLDEIGSWLFQITFGKSKQMEADSFRRRREQEADLENRRVAILPDCEEVYAPRTRRG